MAYDEKLAARVRRVLATEAEFFTERKMFGGLCFMVDGGMCCGVLGAELIARVGKEQHEAALSELHVRPFDFTGRPSRGLVYVAADGVRTEAATRAWVRRALAFVTSAPKRARPSRPRPVRKRLLTRR